MNEIYIFVFEKLKMLDRQTIEGGTVLPYKLNASCFGIRLLPTNSLYYHYEGKFIHRHMKIILSEF